MPTGYTSGILSGKITNFQQFAKQCLRAFGAAIHMRDDDWNAPYKPDKISSYYPEQIKEVNKNIQKLNKTTDKELIEVHKKSLIKDKIRYNEIIAEKKQTIVKLSEYLEQAKQYEPPTSEHQGIKNFMIQQLSDTISSDGNTSYYEERLAEVDIDLENIDPIEIRKSMMENYLEDLKRYEKNLKEDQDRVNDRNEWARKYLESLK